jgi:hypothetical protein
MHHAAFTLPFRSTGFPKMDLVYQDSLYFTSSPRSETSAAVRRSSGIERSCCSSVTQMIEARSPRHHGLPYSSLRSPLALYAINTLSKNGPRFCRDHHILWLLYMSYYAFHSNQAVSRKKRVGGLVTVLQVSPRRNGIPLPFSPVCMEIFRVYLRGWIYYS